MSLPGNKMKILIISQFFYPDVTAAAFRIKETADLLSAKGHEVHVIAGEPHKGQIEGEKIDDGNLKITRVPIYKYQGRGKWDYILHYFSFMLGAMLAAFKHPGKFDVVWASSPPLFTGISGLVVSILKRAKFALDIRDIWPESAAVTGQISTEGFLFKAAKKVEKYLYKKAKLLSCVAKPMAKYLKETSGKNPVVIYNSIPKNMTLPPKQTPANNPTNLEILYIGNMGYCQNLSLVLDAAKILQQKGIKTIKYVLIGNGVEKPILEKRVSEEKLDNVDIRDIVPKSEALELIKTSSALMLHLKADGTMDKTIPSKVFDYMAGGRPILYGLNGEAADILGKIPGNLYYSPTSPDELAMQTINLKKDYKVYQQAAKQNLETVKQNFLREIMADKLEKALLLTIQN
jgi:glycosyltransferase involved in cell wall biosynthesis